MTLPWLGRSHFSAPFLIRTSGKSYSLSASLDQIACSLDQLTATWYLQPISAERYNANGTRIASLTRCSTVLQLQWFLYFSQFKLGRSTTEPYNALGSEFVSKLTRQLKRGPKAIFYGGAPRLRCEWVKFGRLAFYWPYFTDQVCKVHCKMNWERYGSILQRVKLISIIEIIKKL